MSRPFTTQFISDPCCTVVPYTVNLLTRLFEDRECVPLKRMLAIFPCIHCLGRDMHPLPLYRKTVRLSL
jgi:hypothetical protein